MRAVHFQSTAHIGLQAAEALAYAHNEGILHRDIKPSTSSSTFEGRVWVTDFGLAKVQDSAELTLSGVVVGTIRYMAPERFNGAGDSRSDVYGLGVTLYELPSASRRAERLWLSPGGRYIAAGKGERLVVWDVIRAEPCRASSEIRLVLVRGLSSAE